MAFATAVHTALLDVWRAQGDTRRILVKAQKDHEQVTRDSEKIVQSYDRLQALKPKVLYKIWCGGAHYFTTEDAALSYIARQPQLGVTDFRYPLECMQVEDSADQVVDILLHLES